MSGILLLKYFKMLPCEICQTPFIGNAIKKIPSSGYPGDER